MVLPPQRLRPALDPDLDLDLDLVMLGPRQQTTTIVLNFASFLQEMGCLCLCRDKWRRKRRPESSAPPSQAAAASSYAACTGPSSHHASVPAAGASAASPACSATATSTSDSSGARPASSKSLGSSARSIPELYGERGAHSLLELSLRELRAATADFSPLLMVGVGGFGCVYRGALRLPGGNPHGTAVAVKRLNPNGGQGHKEWLAEVQFLGIVEHPNLVKLVGYCATQTDQGPQRLLVYEFMPNKTLDDHLFNPEHPVLPWEVRLQVALGAAEGLLYLHEGLELQIIYRDFKAANILLDEEFRPKLSDFGLAREGPSEGQTHVSTAVMGTYGYAAPDYVQTGHLTTKSDVWSFGVVMYEILTARRSVEKKRPKNEQKLLEWVRRHPADTEQFREIMDTRLDGRYSMRGAREIAKLANSCLAKYAKDRPTMVEVVERLKLAMQHKELDGHHACSVEESSFLHQAPTTPPMEDEAAVSARRRMLHLAALGENANAHARRRLMLMRAAAPRT
ncbi:Protein kinase APK1B, chloroplastic [Hordeum vulgare]|nr:Protein kinase APK1B, chloroplastic [Hordeum vulgare]